MYGLTKTDRLRVLTRLKRQQDFLFENCVDLGSTQVPYADFFQNAWHNSHRYIAELNHRVYSLNEYANNRGLKCIFAVINLPSEYHRKRTIKLKNGQTRLVRNDKFIDDDEHSVRAGSQKLGLVVRSILNSKVFRAIPKEDRCYITTREPHKDGTCHLNFMCFVPAEFVDNCVKAIKRRFIADISYVSTTINNPTSYIMKYIFKTLDDLRDSNGNLDDLSDLTLWYIHNKIPRVTMSRTFVSLDIYRCLKGQISLYKITKMYNSGRLEVLLDSNNRIVQISNDYGELYNKRRVYVKKESKSVNKPISKKAIKSIPVVIDGKNYTFRKGEIFKCIDIPFQPTLAKDYSLLRYFYSLEEKDINTINLQHYGLVKNECIKRKLIEGQIVSLNEYGQNFDVEKYINAI